MAKAELGKSTVSANVSAALASQGGHPGEGLIHPFAQALLAPFGRGLEAAVFPAEQKTADLVGDEIDEASETSSHSPFKARRNVKETVYL